MQAEEHEGGICGGRGGAGKIWTGSMETGFGAEMEVGAGIGTGVTAGAETGVGRGLPASLGTRSLAGLQRGGVEVLRA